MAIEHFRYPALVPIGAQDLTVDRHSQGATSGTLLRWRLKGARLTGSARLMTRRQAFPAAVSLLPERGHQTQLFNLPFFTLKASAGQHVTGFMHISARNADLLRGEGMIRRNRPIRYVTVAKLDPVILCWPECG